MNIRFTEVKYSKRVNLGNYESEEIGVVAVIEEGTEVAEAIQACKDVVAGKAAPKKEEKKTEKKIEKKSSPKKEVKKDAPKKESEAKEEKKEEAPAKDEAKEEKKEEKKTTKKTTKKKVKKKNVVYDRTNDAHKKRMGEVCNEIFGDTSWRRDKEKLKLVKHASEMCHEAEDFLDGDGEVLDSFIEVFKTLAKVD